MKKEIELEMAVREAPENAMLKRKRKRLLRSARNDRGIRLAKKGEVI